MQALAPELDEHGPELAVARGDLQARAHEGAKAAPRPARAAGLRGYPAVEIGAHAQGGGGEDRALVREVVVEDALAQAGLRATRFMVRPA